MKLFLHTLIFFLLVSQFCFAQWVQTNGPSPCDEVTCIGVSGTHLFVGTLIYVGPGSTGGMHFSTDNGELWIPFVIEGANFLWDVAVSGTNLFAGTDAGVFLSTNNGTSWTDVNTGLTEPNVNALAVSGTNLFAGTIWGVFLSTNNGTNWTTTGLTNTLVSSFAIIGTNLFAGTDDGVFLSTNNGTSWTEVNTGLPENPIILTLAVSGTNLFAGTGINGVFLSTNNGTSWTEVNTGLTNPCVSSFAISGTNLFAGTDGLVFLTTNNGASWTDVFAPLTGPIRALAVSDTNLFAGIQSGVWRRPLSEMITSVDIEPTQPTEFILNQNYPNPFNPNTTFKYSIPNESEVIIKVFDIIGNEIEILVNEEKPVGTYEITWYAEELPSGIYFYQLRAGDFVETKKMVLLK